MRIKNLRDGLLTHSLKKAAASTKKRKKNIADVRGGSLDVENAAKVPATVKSTGIKDAATASLTASVLAEQEARNKRRKTDGNKNLDSLFSTKSSGPGKNTDFMSRGFAIPAHQRH